MKNLCAVYIRLVRCLPIKDSIDVSVEHTFLSGRLNRNSRSKRPGLLSAGSIESSLFVAPMTTISPRLSKPSIKASSVDTIELDREKEVMIWGNTWYLWFNSICSFSKKYNSYWILRWTKIHKQTFRGEILSESKTILTMLVSQHRPNKQGHFSAYGTQTCITKRNQ